MAQKRKTLQLDVKGFEDLITKLDSLGGNVKGVVADALEQAAETIEHDTIEAVKKSNLPAGGKYSKGDTEKSIVRNAKVKWEGETATVKVGFDYDKPGAGGFLITGTPKMAPDQALKKIYKSKKYMKDIQNDISDVIQDAINETMGG